MTAVSRSCIRSRQMRRFVPDSAKAFTFPCRIHDNNVRVLIFKWLADSSGVNQVIFSSTRPFL
jgi:hypothetical protein